MLFRPFHLARLAARAGEMRKLPIEQQIGIIIGSAILLNVAFWMLSGMYFEDRTAFYGQATPDHIQSVRFSFMLFSGVVAAAAVVAVMRPAWVGITVAGLASIGALVGGVAALTHKMTPVLPGSLIVAGILMALLVWKTLEQERLAWAFLVGMTSVLAAVLLFGATKVGSALGTDLWTALIIPGLLAVATCALTALRHGFREADPTAPESSPAPLP